MRWLAVGLAALVTAAAVTLVWPVMNDLAAPAVRPSASPALPAPGQQVQRGAYLARAGHCAGCHTAPGGAAYAGGRGIETPFGTVYASNLTPDVATGLGRWSSDDFWQALHHGRSRDGRLLNPVFPYTNTTLVTREDADALYAFLRSLAPVAQPNRTHALRWPYNTQWALAVWRRLYFRPGVYAAEPAQSAAWNRGAYLVRGLGHCAACHSPRNTLGATASEGFEGGLMPGQGWAAPSLHAAESAGVQGWPQADVVALLQTGASPRASVQGPMAEVVYGSTQYLSQADVAAMAVYLRSLPVRPSAPVVPAARADAVQWRLGEQRYHDHCARCHGDQGEGAAGAYPTLAGNRAVVAADPGNLLRTLLQGGYLPATAGNPRPYGMPPFGPVLNDVELAAVATYLRQAWGHQASAVSALQVQNAR